MIQVIQPGLLTTVQDEGRGAYLAFGMPRAGVMDRYAARVANLLCVNPLGAAVLEMTILGGEYRFEAPGRIAVCGAQMPLRLNNQPITAWTAVDVTTADVLEIGAAEAGCRAYLAVAGGIAVPLVMGSRSTYYRAGLGGFAGRALKAGDQLSIGDPSPFAAEPIGLPAEYIPAYQPDINVRLMLGPQDELFSADGVATFLATTYTVSNEADRMGYRLEGAPIAHLQGADIVSDALIAGAIQVPGSGQPIIMMADCGTTGGYAKIATVIGVDLAKIAQAKPQDRIRFVECSEATAILELRQEQARYRQIAEWVSNGRMVATEPEPAGEKCQPEPVQILTEAPRRQPGRSLRLQIGGKSYHVEIEEVK